MKESMILGDLSIGDKFKTRSGSAVYEVIEDTQTIEGISIRMVRVYDGNNIYEKEMFPYIIVNELM